MQLSYIIILVMSIILFFQRQRILALIEKKGHLIRLSILLITYTCKGVIRYTINTLLRYHPLLFLIICMIYYFAFFRTPWLFSIGHDAVIWLISSLGFTYPEYLTLNQELIISFFSYADFGQANDKSVQSFLLFITKISAAGLPIGLTFYYFFYREQKATSESALNRNKTRSLAIIFIVTLIFFLIYTLHLLLPSDDYLKVSENSLIFTINYFDRILISLICFIVVLISAVTMVIKLFQNINIAWLLSRSIDETEYLINLVKYIATSERFKFIRSDIYNDLNYLIESIYQMLIYTVDKNLIKAYHHNFTAWNNVVHNMQSGKRVIWTGLMVDTYLHLFEVDKEDYYGLYRAILKNHFLLVVTLYNKHKIREGAICLKRLLLMNPRVEQIQRENYVEDRLTVEFFTVLYELSLFLYKNDHIGLYPLINEMNIMLKEKAEFENVIIVYRSLLIKAIDKNDPKLLTELTYALLKSTEVSLIQVKSIKEPASPRVEAMVRGLNRNKAIQERKNIGMCLYLLLQGLLKSIELSHYASTGYLVKCIVSNFDSDLLSAVHEQLLENKLSKDKKLDDRKLAKEINVSFNINARTATYCMQKLTILIYAQQRFVKEENVHVSVIPKSYIDTSILHCNYLNYLIEKITAVDKYGLLFLKRDHFMDSVKGELCLISTIRTIWYE